ncbi:MAG: hypothetical protein HZC55_07585 [Verrucomicrobia bacterium]|nr:hypothetical protein [Verrucomicrobiota bacterium]
MAFFSLLTRSSRSGVLWNINEHMVQLARLPRPDLKPVLVDQLAEFAVGDDDGIGRWLRETFSDRGRGFVPGYCGFHPTDRVLLRETINTKRMAEPGYLPQLLAEQAKLTAVNDWSVAALHPIEGEVLTSATPSRPGLLVGLPLTSVRELQGRLRKLGVRPRRLELGTLALLGALTRYIRETSYPHATVVCEIGLGQTRVYFLARDGVHTPATLPHGLVSIMEATMKEIGAPGIGAARDALYAPTDELRGHSRRLVRVLTRHLKPAIDYFEMQTGQPIGALYCAHLPVRLAWLEEALCTAVDLQFLVPDLEHWLSLAGVQLAPGLPAPSRSWLQPLSLIGQLTPPANEPK